MIGGHIHQGVVTARAEFDVLAGANGSIVLATAPGLGRPRPHRSGEAQGAMVYAWDAETLTALTYVLDDDRFAQVARRAFPRRRLDSSAVAASNEEEQAQ